MYRVVVNARAGTVLEIGAEPFRKRIEEGFSTAGCQAQVVFAEPRALAARLTEVVKDGGSTPVVAGGDGTINAALPILMRSERPVAVLPLGTVNVLGRDLGIVGAVEQQIAAICSGVPIAMDLGSVNGRLFHSLSGMGFFSLMAREREYARRRVPFSRAAAFALAATRSILFTRAVTVEILIADERLTVQADAVMVTVNSFDGPEWRRRHHDGGEFEVHILNAGGLYSRTKAALQVVSGRWKTSPNLHSFTGQEVTLTRRDKRRGHVTFDGEVARMAGPLQYRLLPKALQVIAAAETAV